MQEQRNKDGKALKQSERKGSIGRKLFLLLSFSIAWFCGAAKLYRDTGSTRYGKDSSSVRTFNAKLFTERKL
jgi:hypothetical protein